MSRAPLSGDFDAGLVGSVLGAFLSAKKTGKDQTLVIRQLTGGSLEQWSSSKPGNPFLSDTGDLNCRYLEGDLPNGWVLFKWDMDHPAQRAELWIKMVGTPAAQLIECEDLVRKPKGHLQNRFQLGIEFTVFFLNFGDLLVETRPSPN
jgi:hypothetical protein